MAEIYLFNPQSGGNGIAQMSVVVNGYATAPYVIRSTLKVLNYVPYSTSGERDTGAVPNGANFGLENSIRVSLDTTALYDVAFPVPPPVREDLILYIFRSRLALFGPDGNHLADYTPLQQSAAVAPASQATAAVAEDAAGTVYVFNLFSEPIDTFSINGKLAGSIPAWSAGGTGQPSRYTPSVLLLKRTLNASDSPGHLYNGINQITVFGPSGGGSFVLTVDGNQFPITQDLLLYVLRNWWGLTDQYNVALASGPVNPLSAAASPRPDTL